MSRWMPIVTAALAAAACAASPYFDPAKPHRAAEGFRNNDPHPEKGGFWAWQWERWRLGLPREPEGGWRFETVRPELAALREQRWNPSITWIGHATLLLQIGGVNVLTDPMFSERASPVKFAGPRRVVPPLPALADLPRIDLVLISHNHYDHLDADSVKALARQAGGQPKFLVPLGVKAWFAGQGIDNVAEFDWWERTSHAGLDIHFVPVQHWSKRTLWDTNQTLWGGWVVRHPQLSFFFAGDTGYSKDFADIGAKFGGFDLAAIPIGSYAPRWFMQTMHADPDESVRIHRDVRARQSVAIHWGTLASLSDEDLDEPPRRLATARDSAGLPAHAFFVMKHGETRRLERDARAQAADALSPSRGSPSR